MELYCCRCGRLFGRCPHLTTRGRVNGQRIDAAHAQRIAARYELGKQFDPEHHDTNDYATEDT